MFYFILKRLAATIPVMGFVALFVFMLLHLTPGDPAGVIAGQDATAEDIARIRTTLGFDRPVHEQFVIWVGNIIRGDLGVSVFSNVPVAQLILQRVEPTVSLAITTIIFSVLIAVPLGTIAAWKAGTSIDRTVMILAVLGFSVPAFVLGYCLIYVFALQAGLFPVQGFVSIREGFLPFLRSIALPTIMLGTSYMVLITRIARASVLEVLEEDYVRTARAKGVRESSVLIRHALRSAAVPIVTVIGLGFAFLISGVVITETVFNFQGIGRLTVDAIAKRDYPVIQGVILVVSFLYVIINTIIDITYAYLDPRIRF